MTRRLDPAPRAIQWFGKEPAGRRICRPHGGRRAPYIERSAAPVQSQAGQVQQLGFARATRHLRRKMALGAQQYLAGTRTPAQLGSDVGGIAHQRQRLMLSRPEYSDRHFTAMDADADAGVDRILTLPARSDRRETMLNGACRVQGLVNLRVARISDAESGEHVSLGNLKNLPAPLQNRAREYGEEFPQQRYDIGGRQLLDQPVVSMQVGKQHGGARRLGAARPHRGGDERNSLGRIAWYREHGSTSRSVA